jgi:predicted RNase H-like nuclease
MPWVAGVDGCRAGWVVVLLEQQPHSPQEHHVKLCVHFAEVLALSPRPLVIAVDIPIGLLGASQPGGRECDRQARRLLGHRASSVFTPPIRALLAATQYEQVRSQGLSIQTFGILPKIREVDQLMTPELQKVVYEAHPELAFRSLAGAPMRHNKKTHEGREERLRTLEQAPGRLFRKIRHIFENARRTYKCTQVALDDILDAYVVAWIALRIASGQGNRLPTNPRVDQKGLRMEIWY